MSKKAAHSRPVATQRATLKMLREFRNDFSTISLGGISVTFATPEADRPKAEKAKKAPLTAIEALSRKPPVFDFEEPS